jgi:prepilin-type N-terminal cleavage/methylation domain-containing protein
MYKTFRRRDGFTIVELLIVIVVIAILATITIVAFNGVQGRARDSQRMADINAIAKGLEIYRQLYGDYPLSSNNGAGSWEVSSISPDTFLDDLTIKNVMSSVPVDPTNTGNSDVSGSKIYMYYRYSAGTAGCPSAFYVLIAKTGETGAVSPNSPGFKCGTYTASGFYVRGNTVN